MRRQLTAAFVLLTVSVLVVFAAVRASELRSLVREREAVHLDHDAGLVARSTEAWAATGRPVPDTLLRGMVSSDQTLTVVVGGAPPVHVTGSSYAAGDDGDGLLVSRAHEGQVSVTLAQASSASHAAFVESLRPLFFLLLLLAVLAGFLGYTAARLLAAPFDRLALAAGALGRGRWDLDLPRSRIPEAESIAVAMRGSAARIAKAQQEDRSNLHHASHELRTPLTGLRLELEELSLDPALGAEHREALERSLARVGRVQAQSDEILALIRERSSAEGAEEPLSSVAQRIAQAWDDALAGELVRLRASVDGDVDLGVVPGPLEQVLDAVLAVLVDRAAGPVLLDLSGGSDRITATVAAAGTRPGARPRPEGFAGAVTLAAGFGGRVTGDPLDGGRMQIWLPRR